ncbi:MAG: hypothetical protein EZS28_005227 [Streblomastix strix]|uniref:Uncharacterized protein n=2 Tax=Streblomastix strix TaxID=222440 RepID=A0A5J4WWR0_9EUKA|nr:MAG: hypothetical protein EZS28_005227 [Streblomastix strix]
MFGTFVDDLLGIEKQVMGGEYSLKSVGNMLVLMFGQLIFCQAQHRFSVIGEVNLEIADVLMIIFMVLFGGFTTAFSDDTSRTMQINASNVTSRPQFTDVWIL